MPGGIPVSVDEQFLDDVAREIVRARAKFPAPNPNIAALTEEVGELAKALLHVREGKLHHWSRVYDEAVQVAVMALRAASEGDATIGAIPTEDLCR
jgi:NTP pyrophosphatase (non-canonical NTP hydrolase)